jgi:hypothetical protein
MRFTLRGINIFGLCITTKKQLECMNISIDYEDVITILRKMKEVKK